MVAVRNEYRPIFGREQLTLWTGAFCSEYHGAAVELPRGGGYMIRTWDGRRVRVECESPRTESNFRRVDEAINAALNDL